MQNTENRFLKTRMVLVRSMAFIQQRINSEKSIKRITLYQAARGMIHRRFLAVSEGILEF